MCAWSVRSHALFSNLPTVSWRLDPRSARAGAVERQFLNLRVTAYQMCFGLYFSAHFVTFGPHFRRLEHMRKQEQIKTRNVIKFVCQNKSQKSDLLRFFRCPVSKVRQGGPKCCFWCPWVVPKVSFSVPKDTKSDPLYQKWNPAVIPDQYKSIKWVR